MGKIFVSDLVGTLIPPWIGSAEYLYSKEPNLLDVAKMSEEYIKRLMDKQFVHLSKLLVKFLKDGNYLNVVTSSVSHDGADQVITSYISRLYKNMWDYRKQISVFIQGGERELNEISKTTPVYSNNGITFVGYKEGIMFPYIDNKTKVFDILSQQPNFNPNELYAVGDDSQDIPMLLKCNDLGGTSSLINYQMYTGVYPIPYTVDNIILLTASKDYNFMIEDMALQYNPNFFHLDAKSQHTIISDLKKNNMSWRKQEIVKLYNLLNEGNLDIDDLMRQHMVYDKLSDYNELVPIYGCGELVEKKRYKELKMYPTFTDYYNRILKK